MIGMGLGRFGDKRLECVGGALLDAMQRQRTLCVHRLAKDRNQAIQFGRFLDNPAVTTQEMLMAASEWTAQHAAGRHVLAIEDTTELHFAAHAASEASAKAATARTWDCSCIRCWRWMPTMAG